MRELFSPEAEHGLIGAIFRAPDLAEQIIDAVDTADFSDFANAALFQAIKDTQDAGHPIDVVTVSNVRAYLPNDDSLLAYAAEIAQNVTSVTNWKTYAQILKERAALRRVVEVADVIRDSASSDLPLADVIARAQQATADLRDLGGEEADYLPVSHYVLQAAETVNDRAQGRIPLWASTGLVNLDELMRGIRPKKVTIIGGLPASGKTTLALQIAQYNAVQKKAPWLVFSLEMPGEELGIRTIASLGGIQLRKLEDPKHMADDDWARMQGAAAMTADAPLYINQNPYLTASRIRAIARKFKREHGLAGVVVDYITLVRSEGQARSRSEEVGAISKAFLRLAKELDIPVIPIAQLNRESVKRAGKKPQSSDLRDSGEIEADASCILMVHRDNDTDEGKNGVTEILMTKCRHAPVGSCLLQQQGEFGRFADFKGNPLPSDDEVAAGRTYAQRFSGRGA